MIPKFRAWDKLNKGMCDVANVDFMTKVVELRHDIPFYFLPFSEVVLMQSTGLKDKNGVEIFEGHIVHNEQHTYMVRLGEFTDSDYFQNTTQHQTGFYIVDIHTDETFPFYSMTYEVIGNVCENSDLLEVAE